MADAELEIPRGEDRVGDGEERQQRQRRVDVADQDSSHTHPRLLILLPEEGSTMECWAIAAAVGVVCFALGYATPFLQVFLRKPRLD